MYFSVIGSILWHRFGDKDESFLKDAVVHRERHIELAKKSKIIKQEDIQGKIITEEREGFNEELVRAQADQLRRSTVARMSGNDQVEMNRVDSLPAASND